MTIEKDFFRRVMGRFATGVTVVTTRYQDKLGGLTVNAFCSVSLTPPLILVCIDLASQTVQLIRESQVFAVNMLTEEQEHLSRCFATHSAERFEQFCRTPYHTAATGAPILDNTLAFIDARVVAEYPGGDHAIFLGQVVAMGTTQQVVFANEAESELSTLIETPLHNTVEDKKALIYYRAQYGRLAKNGSSIVCRK